MPDTFHTPDGRNDGNFMAQYGGPHSVENQLHRAAQAAKAAGMFGLFVAVNRASQVSMTPKERAADNRKTLTWALAIIAVVLLLFFGMAWWGSLLPQN